MGMKDELANVKAGDNIVIKDGTGFGPGRRLVKVTKVTKSRVHTAHQEFLMNGKLVGGGAYSQVSAFYATPELTNTALLEMKVYRLRRASDSIDWDALTPEQLTAVDALYKSLPAKVKG